MISYEEFAAKLVCVVLLSCFWRGLYIWLSRLLQGKVKVADSMVSFFHSLASVGLILLTDGTDQAILLKSSEALNTTQQELVITVSLSYFIHDTLKGGWQGWRLTMLLHHIGGLIFLSLPLVTRLYGTSTLQALLFLEASNPCFHGRRILSSFGVTGRLYIIFEILYVATFAYCRLMKAFVFTIDVLINRDYMSPFYVLGAIFFQTVSLIFMGCILQHLQHKYIYPGFRQLSINIADGLLNKNSTEDHND